MPVESYENFRIDPSDLPGEAVIFGCTEAMHEIRNKIDGELFNNLPVLIQGESGTGKEVVARFLHSRSNQHDAPFVKLNCSAIPANLLEKQLFGYEKDSTSGARDERKGLVEIAEGGTLFLDAIEDMHSDLQEKLIQLLEDGIYSRIGGSEKRRGRVRVICATNADLQKRVEAGKFRADLYSCLDPVSFRLSALRERKGDIPQLCEYLLQKLARQFSRTAPRLNPATLQLLKEWNWPGNLRELENWIARAIILGDDLAPGAELRRRVAVHNTSDTPKRGVIPLKETAPRLTSPAVSTAMIRQVLRANRWNRRKTAEELHMSYRTLLYKLREVGIPQRRRSHKGFPPAH